MSTLLKVENLTQQFVLDKSFLDQIKLKNGRCANGWFGR